MSIELTQTRKDILQFFEEPRCISLTDIAEEVGYGRTTILRNIPALVDAGLLKRTYYPHIWAKPIRYERTTKA